METTKQLLHKPEQPERERLEIIEKKVDIQRKRVEIKKEKLFTEEIVIKREIALDEQRIIIDKIGELRNVLSGYMIDSGKGLLPSDNYYQPIVEDNARDIVTKKMIELIKKL